MKILEIDNLVKTFGEVRAVDGISFSVERGALFAFLGLNGAGKSTTINVICTLLPKNSGRVLVAGEDLDSAPERVREKIGIVFQHSVLDPSQTVASNLATRASLYGMTSAQAKKRISELADTLGFGEYLDRKYGKLSGGQRRKVDIARGLLHSPELLILDEPTTGLDPQTRRAVWDVIGDIRRTHDTTVFLTTHYMEEANGADDVVILDAGKIAAQGSPIELKEKFSRDTVTVYAERSGAADKLFDGEKWTYDEGAYRVVVDGGERAKALLDRCAPILRSFEVKKGDMDDVFLTVTGKRPEGGAI